MPTRYFAANTLASFFRTASTVIEATTAGRFNSPAASAISIPNDNTQYIYSYPFGPTAGSKGYVRFDWYVTAGNNTNVVFQVTNGAIGLVRMKGLSSSVNYNVEYWNGTTWVLGGTVPFTAAVNTYVFCIEYGVGVTVYYNGAAVLTFTMSGTLQTAFDTVYFYGVGNASTTYVSQVMIADYDLRDSKYASRLLTANSATNTGQASGSYTDVGEVSLDETTSVNITTSGNKAGFTKAAYTLPAGYVIAGMVVAARARATGAITNGKLGIRSGGTNYSSSNKNYNGGYEPRQHLVTTDPATGSAFTETNFNNAEPYIEAV